MKYVQKERIDLLFKELKKAEENLNRIRREYGNNPDLLILYEPSAIFLVNFILIQIQKTLPKGRS
jgi:hypothetical protein